MMFVRMQRRHRVRDASRFTHRLLYTDSEAYEGIPRTLQRAFKSEFLAREIRRVSLLHSRSVEFVRLAAVSLGDLRSPELLYIDNSAPSLVTQELDVRTEESVRHLIESVSEGSVEQVQQCIQTFQGLLLKQRFFDSFLILSSEFSIYQSRFDYIADRIHHLRHRVQSLQEEEARVYPLVGKQLPSDSSSLRSLDRKLRS